MEFEHRICGIPCTIVITERGDSECGHEYEIYARGKKPADWLRNKMKSQDYWELNQAIDDFFEAEKAIFMGW